MIRNQIVIRVADDFDPVNSPIGSLPRTQTQPSMSGARGQR
jgi:hypothetical protein